MTVFVSPLMNLVMKFRRDGKAQGPGESHKDCRKHGEPANFSR